MLTSSFFGCWAGGLVVCEPKSGSVSPVIVNGVLKKVQTPRSQERASLDIKWNVEKADIFFFCDAIPFKLLLMRCRSPMTDDR